MKKGLFMLIFSVVVFAFTGCRSDKLKTGTETVSEIKRVIITETVPSTTASEESETVLEYVTSTENVDNAKTEYSPEPWETAYADYIDSMWDEGQEPYVETSFSLIFLDDDDIPELFIDTGYEAGGEIVLTYYNDEVVIQQLSRCGSQYIEKSGLIYTNTGHMGYYPVEITKLKNGEFSLIASGLKVFRSDEENMGYELDDEGEPISDYEWEGETVTEDEFYAKIDEIFDREQGIYPERRYSAEEMISKLRTGACTSQGHRYELIQADVDSWTDAQNLCKEKGGYLATITSPDEQDMIAGQIANENMGDVSFYVGYRWGEKIDGEYYSDRWINSDGSFTMCGFMHGLWKYDAPDYEHDEWEYEYQDCGLVKYYESTNQIYLFEAPERLLDFSPEYAGKMGYICEYDQ